MYNNQDFTWTPTDNSTDTWTYWAATAYENNNLIRVYNWPPGTDYTHVSWNDFSVNFNRHRQLGQRRLRQRVGIGRRRPAHPAGTTLYGAKGVSLTKAVATFSDADPGGTASDYAATIHWGDGTTSAGTIGGHFRVTGTHTYTSTGTKTISVTIKDAGGASGAATSTAHIGSLPAITAVSPTSGTHLGGKAVTITGTNLSGATSVKFGTAAATITTDTATKITVKTPAHATGTVDIRVTTKYGTSNITIHDKYKFT